MDLLQDIVHVYVRSSQAVWELLAPLLRGVNSAVSGDAVVFRRRVESDGTEPTLNY